MDVLLMKNTFKISVPVFIFFLFIPALMWGEGFQEEKLFDGNFYSTGELRQKVETHKKDLQDIAHQIKALEIDLDWLVLKINQIQDSGRTGSSALKQAVTKKEKKIEILQKTKNRLEYLVQYYSEKGSSDKDQRIEDTVLERKIQHKGATVKTIVPKIPAPMKRSTDADGEKKSDTDNQVTKSELQAAIKGSGLGDWLEVVETGPCLRMETTLPILFSSGSATVAKEYKLFLNNLAVFLKPYDVNVIVSGYADTVPIKSKTYPSNFELGATRAANIVHQLVRSGLKPAIFKIESAGEYRFAAEEMSKQKSFERRAEVTVIFTS
ncbi:OmpA family protein [Desulfobacula sp.]|uniref:OmpA/MotB family protein n=1 Tax=Desulfobacula sp. TaxID=2593537 RepID=UPI00261B1238|nr:OmpA family protein [Desulfobacula sp.]